MLKNKSVHVASLTYIYMQLIYIICMPKYMAKLSFQLNIYHFYSLLLRVISWHTFISIYPAVSVTSNL